MPTERRPTDSFARILLLLTLVGLAARVLFLLLEPKCDPTGDEPAWLAIGLRELGRPNRGLNPFRVRLIFWPPLYPYLIAVLNRIFHSVTSVLWTQVVLGALLVPAVGRAGHLAMGRRVGLVAAAFTALYPDLLWYPAHFWSETLYLSLMWWAIERTLAADAARSWRPALLAGVLWGLSSLTRELSLYLVPIVAVWLGWPAIASRRRVRRGAGEPVADVGPAPPTGRAAWGRAAALLLGTVLVVAPWTVRNAIVYHAFVPISTMGGPPLWQGNAQAITGITNVQITAVLTTMPGPIEADRYCRAMAWRAIVSRQPLWLFQKLAEQMPEFWKASAEVLDHLVGRAACGPLSTRQTVAIEVAFVGPYLILLGMALAGLARLRLGRGPALLLTLLAAYNAAHVVALSSTRYRLPVVPVLFLLAAAALTGGREGVLHPASTRRWLLLGLLVVVALLVLYPGMEELMSWRLITGGRLG
jgi:hypothetical protein